MAKHPQKKNIHQHTKPETDPTTQTSDRHWRIPAMMVLFLAVWAWAALYYAPVLRITREYSFWAPDSTLMYYESGRPWGQLWCLGLMLLQLYRWPIVGGALTALMITASTHLTAYCLRLKGWWRLLQYIPATLYLGYITFIGYNLYFEAETGMLMGIPATYLIVITVLSVIIRSFSHSHHIPSPWQEAKNEAPKLYRSHIFMALVPVLVAIGITHWMRPYVRVTAQMQCQMIEQDWKAMAETARKNGELSYRPIAAYYAIATVMRGEQGSRMFDIRMDYDDPYIHGFNGTGNNATNYYLMDCDLAAGLVQTAIHHGVEQMTMNGPSIRTLKVLTKCALLTGEWEVAKKYLRILEHVPFEGDFVHKYRAMVGNEKLVNADPEFKMIRLTEPVRDLMENSFVQPVFLGYNAALLEGRSINALWNSLTVQLYTKTMPQFIERCGPLQGTALPSTYAQALAILSSKQPQLLQQFPDIAIHQQRLSTFINHVKPLMSDRPGNAPKLYEKYKGYYPYYYFFGNLKATRKKSDAPASSNSGVN